MNEKVIQFGEGGFLRGFVDWMLQIVNEKTAFDGKVVVVQPIENGMCDMLSAQDCMYTHVIRGVEGVDTKLIDVISRCVNPYTDYDAYLALAENPDFRFVVSNTTEAGSVPSTLLTIETPARSAQMPNWSIAAARKVSAAPKTTFLPSFLS